MADYSSSGLWAMDGASPPWRHVMIEHNELRLSAELAARFNRLIDGYDAEHTPDLEQFNEVGLELAKALKLFLGPQAYVEYEPEWTGDVPPAPIVIK